LSSRSVASSAFAFDTSRISEPVWAVTCVPISVPLTVPAAVAVSRKPKPSEEKRITSPTRKMSSATPNEVAVESAEALSVVMLGIPSSSSHSNFGFGAGTVPSRLISTVSGATFGSSS
jgi:hypothetical protein